MEREPHTDQTELTGIHINLAEPAIEFENEHGTIGRLVFTAETVLYEGQPLLLTSSAGSDTPNVSLSPSQLAHPGSDAAPATGRMRSLDSSVEQ